jgi:serine/threonine protein kinase/Flp pilus assembly protein TadD
MAFTTGTRFGPYEIQGLLGAGGMGEVYRARDDRLGRDVAIKILPDAWLADPDRRARFDREARLLAQLNHPHVGAIYGLEERDGVLAFVLELVEGPTLAELLKDRGRATADRPSGLPLAEALRFARQVAEALDATHERGIVHRDLKPANVKVTRSGTVKVIDFGLARDVGGSVDRSDASGETMAATEVGIVLGTPGYMSPEQARGKAVDKRSDIWSFGCVLYELLTGRAPFHGDSVADAFAAVLVNDPDWRALPSGTPPGVERLLKRCLEKDLTRRLRDIGEARIELETAEHTPSASGAAPAPARSWVTVAILPFVNLSSDPEQQYFSDGLMDETITALGEMNSEHIRVLARTSSMAYQKTAKTASQIGRELRADYLVETSVRREANHVRIATPLIRTEDETRIWSARFDRTPVSVLSVQDEIGRAIAGQVHGTLSRSHEPPLPRQSTQSPEAHDLYLRGRYLQYRFDLPAAIAAFEAAVALDPSFAQPYTGLAWVYAGIPIVSDAEPLHYLEKSRVVAAKALELGPNSADAHAAVGWVEFFLGWDWRKAEASLRRAVELNPNSATARFYLAHLLSNAFQHDEALEMVLRARDLDPLSAVVHSLHGQFLFDARRYREALEPIRRAMSIDPHFFHGPEILSRVLIQLGDFERALEACDSSYQLSRGMLFAFARKGYVLARMGRSGEAHEVLASLRRIAGERHVAPLTFALVHAGLGNREETLAALEQAVDAHAAQLVLLPTDPVWDAVRGEPRFRALGQKLGFRVNPS